MKNRILSAALAALLILSLAACGSQPKTTDPATTPAGPDSSQTPATTAQPATAPATTPEHTYQVLSPSGELLAEIDYLAAATAADDGIFYSVFHPEENKLTDDAEYHLFRTSDKTDIFLGRLENQGYEALYSRTELNGVVYTLALTGDPMDNEQDTLWLLQADAKAGTLNRYKVSEHAHPYTALAVVNGKLLIMNHEMNEPKTDSVYEFDPASASVRQVLTLSTASDSLRGLSADGDGFCVLRLSLSNGMPNGIFLDRYDSAYNKTSETSITDLFTRAAQNVHGIMSAEDAMNEAGMPASAFSLTDGRFLAYENFSITHIIFDLETGETLFAGDDLYPSSLGGGDKVFYKMLFPEGEDKTPEFFRLQNGQIEHPTFTLPEDYLIQGLSHSPAGTWLARMTDGTGANRPDVYILWQEP